MTKKPIPSGLRMEIRKATTRATSKYTISGAERKRETVRPITMPAVGAAKYEVHCTFCGWHKRSDEMTMAEAVNVSGKDCPDCLKPGSIAVRPCK